MSSVHRLPPPGPPPDHLRPQRPTPSLPPPRPEESRPEVISSPAGASAVCSRCGNALRPGVKFCDKCGAAVTAPSPVPQPPSVTACSRCGKEIKPGAKFCESCGAAVTAPSPAVCSRCGQPLKPGVKFCGSCGQPLSAMTTAPAAPPPAYTPPARPVTPPPVAYAPPAPPVVEPQAEEEPVIGVIPGLERPKGRLKAESFNLVVTPGRLVFALITQKMMNDAIQEARAEAKRQGKGVLAQVAAQMNWLEVIGDRYQAMPVEAILAEQPGNFFIPNDQIEAAEIAAIDPDADATGYYLVIETRSEKHQFTLKGGQWPHDTRQLLQQVLGDVVQAAPAGIHIRLP